MRRMRVVSHRSGNTENNSAVNQNLIPNNGNLFAADNNVLAIQEARDVEVAENESSTDSDLTPLAWLQNQNLLRGVRELPKTDMMAARNNMIKAMTPAQRASALGYLNYFESENDAGEVDYVTSKPPFSFSCLIFMAIEDSPQKALPVKDIYVWIVDHFPYYRTAPTGWKNSVRHNLSLNKCFKKVEKLPNAGKGSLWMVENRYRDCLIQALQKTPGPYQAFVKEFSMRNFDIPYQDYCENDVAPPQDAPVRQTRSRFSKNEEKKYEEIVKQQKPIARRESAEEGTKEQPQVQVTGTLEDDVDAAAAMLFLKHGSSAVPNKQPEPEDYVIYEEVSTPANSTRSQKRAEQHVTTAASEDHNYSNDKSPRNVMPNPLPSELYLSNGVRGMGSYMINCREEDAEERRRIVEGADALLNLAGIKTHYNTRKRFLYNHEGMFPSPKRLKIIDSDDIPKVKQQVPSKRIRYQSLDESTDTDSELETHSQTHNSSAASTDYSTETEDETIEEFRSLKTRSKSKHMKPAPPVSMILRKPTRKLLADHSNRRKK